MSDAPQHPSRLTLTLFAAMLLATGVINAGAARHEAAGAKAVSFTLPARHGTVALDSLRGRVVLVDFWASWCEPCRKSFPWMKTMVERYGAKGFTVVAIDLDKERADALAFLERYDAPFPVAFDPSGQTAEAYKVGAMPTSVLVDRAGTIVYTHAGFDAHAAVAAESLIAGACAR
jgi:peroxiredoxin